MKNCPNCGKKIKWYYYLTVFTNPDFPFCSFGCWYGHKNIVKKREGIKWIVWLVYSLFFLAKLAVALFFVALAIKFFIEGISV